MSCAHGSKARRRIAQQVSEKTGVPAGLLVGDDEESMSAYAQKLDQFAHPKPQGMPNQGMQPSGTAGANPMGDVVNQMFDNLN